MKAPTGFSEILTAYGDIHEYVREDGTLEPRWEVEKLAFAQLPFPIPLSWAPSKRVTRMRVHRVLVTTFEKTFQDLADNGLWQHIHEYGGAFAFRLQRGSGSKVSLHAFGAAVDLNPRTNPLGHHGDMPRTVVEVFERRGFVWGGNFGRPDSMHFQFAAGY